MYDIQAKLRYAFNALFELTVTQILSYIKNDRVELIDLVALIKILENVFRNLNRVRKA